MPGSKERRNRILERLNESAGPLTGAELAAENNVSRQVIVQDMAVLRAAGVEIFAGPQGYRLMQEAETDTLRAVVAVNHKPEETEEELFLIVDSGAEVLDVIVEHEIYGEIRSCLRLTCRDDVRIFLRRFSESNALLLSQMTGGIHLHTITARSREKLERAVGNLRERGFLVE